MFKILRPAIKKTIRRNTLQPTQLLFIIDSGGGKNKLVHQYEYEYKSRHVQITTYENKRKYSTLHEKVSAIFNNIRNGIDNSRTGIGGSETNVSTPNEAFIKKNIYKYGNCRKFDKVEEYLEEMKRGGIKLDVNTYNSLINVYGKVGKFDKVEEYLKEMKRGGMKLNVGAYNSLVSMYGKYGTIN